MPVWLRVVECIAVPAVLGASLYALFEAWDRRRRRAKPEDALPSIDYMI
jgi:hypothetical protein